MIPRSSISLADACPTAEATLQLRTSGSSRSRSADLEQLAVPDVGQELLLLQVDDGDSHADGAGEGAAADLVDAREEPGAREPRKRRS